MFTHAQTVIGADGKPHRVVPGWDSYPFLLIKSIQVVRPSCSFHSRLSLITLVVLDGLHRLLAPHVDRGPVVVNTLLLRLLWILHLRPLDNGIL